MADLLITGGTGRLGRVLRKLLPDAIAPTRAELDITDYAACVSVAAVYRPKTVIHCAGFVDTAAAEIQRDLCWAANVEGTRNTVRAFQPCRFVYLSSTYVFDGERGNYSEGDTPGPLNFYGLTKLCGEQIVQEYQNTLIIRPAIRQDGPWRFPKAFIDQWTSDIFVSERAPDIVKAALSAECGILHMGGKRRTIHELASTVSKVGTLTRSEFTAIRLPRDTSLNGEKWDAIKGSL